MSTTINFSNNIFTNIQTLVLYQDGTMPKYPLDGGVLAPSTDVLKPLYSSGRLLAQYGSDAPSAGLIGMFVNYDPASAVASQAVCVGILPTGYYNLTGIDLTNNTTATATINNVNVARLLSGVELYQATVVAQNETAVVTGFNTQFSPVFVTNSWLDGVQNAIIAIP